MTQSLNPLMILGATSNAGKSLVATGFCRWFSRGGYKVHPFKSQNMSLNAMVTPEGDEIGIAQHSQALASDQIPSRHHNPILLKPQGDMTSQVIVQGKLHETTSARDYYKKKDFYASRALESFQKLHQEADIVVLEGAGSPVELNLMDRDIANLYMARKANAKCILVVNIELGGFFATTKGTLDLIPEDDRKNIIGVIVNNFRGDPTLFIEDLSSFEKTIGVPILGVIPHIENLALDVEDSVSLSDLGTTPHSPVKKIRIVRLPHIANFNEFQIFDHCPGVDWSFTDNPTSLAEADIIILPGTKMTLEDLIWLRAQKIDTVINQHVEKGKELIGICGGFQMLGKTLSDSQGLESASIKTAEGLGFFDMDTEFHSQKKLHQVTVTDKDKSHQMKAYEVHMGDGRPTNATSQLIVNRQNNQTETIHHEGWTKDSIFGTYLHGLFENRSMLERILPQGNWPDMHQLRNSTFESLADAIDQHLDMKYVMTTLKNNKIFNQSSGM